MANLQELIPAIFTGPGGQRLTPEQIAQRQQIAQSLIGRATDTRPDAGGWASVLTKGLLGYQSGAGERAADNAIAQNAATSEASIASMLGGLSGGSGFPTAVAGGASPTGAIATGTPVAVPSAPEIREGLINRGLQPHIADAFILNFQDESGLNPGINEAKPLVPGSRGGYGLYQLTGPRRREYEAFAADRKVPLNSVNAQLDFLMNELQGSESGAAKSILSAPDTATAAQAIVNNFLRPAPEHRQARAAKYGRVATTPQEAIAQVSPVEQAIEPSQFDNRWNAGSVSPEPQPMQQYTPGQVVTGADGQTYQNVEQLDGSYALSRYNPNANQPSASPELLAQNDMMLGGALSPSGSSPVAQALSGYFPEAPSMQSQQQVGGGVNPAVIAALSNPYASQQERQIAGMLLGRQLDANDPMKQAEQQYKMAQVQALQDKAANPNGDESFFGNPVAIQNQDGTISYGQIGNKGSFKPIQLGEGQTFAPPTKTIDTGTEVIMTDQAGNVISRTPKENRTAAAETAGGTVEGRTEAEKRLAAPGDIQAAQTALDVLNQIENHPGLDMGTGILSAGNKVWGTQGYGFENLVKQAKSGAFLSAIQQMRGMGALSNAEGAAATAAITRMDTAASKKDFLKAVSDYRQIVQNGLDRANNSMGSSRPSPSGTGKRTSTGVTWSVE